MGISEVDILNTMQILTKRNPLGDRRDEIDDLDDYRTEAQDILFLLGFDLHRQSPVRIVQDVLNQAFHLSLSVEECRAPKKQILGVIRSRKE